jgi:hypothetical protein
MNCLAMLTHSASLLLALQEAHRCNSGADELAPAPSGDAQMVWGATLGDEWLSDEMRETALAAGVGPNFEHSLDWW